MAWLQQDLRWPPAHAPGLRLTGRTGDETIPIVYGQTGGLKASQVARLERLYRRRVPVHKVMTPEVARSCTELSRELRRRIGLAITRRGIIDQVIVGTGRGLAMSNLKPVRLGSRFLRGIRLVQTHLYNEPLVQEDLTGLALYRLDLIAGIGVAEDGLPLDIHVAHLLPANPKKQVYESWPPESLQSFQLDCREFVESLESEMARAGFGHAVGDRREAAILVSASKYDRETQAERLEELAELVHSADGDVLDTVIQRTHEHHPKYLLGIGKLKEVVIKALQRGADLLVFDQTLSPAQVQAIADVTEMRVIDRTQLILDIFARRAHSREGKVQVELAQLRYLLPRLSHRHTALSRLGGGIGGRGPGETKLESDRRRVRDRIGHLERELASIGRHQAQRRARRVRHMLPVISMVGYTNAGKSSLLNVLTHSQVAAGDRPFETLDTFTRRLRFPRDREVIVTDTVGFIRDLPSELMGAFRTTLEELRGADILLHVVDASATDPEAQIAAVQHILSELDLDRLPRMLAFNKCDRLVPQEAEMLCRRFGAIGVSALHPETLEPLIAMLDRALTDVTRPAFQSEERWVSGGASVVGEGLGPA